MIEVKGKYIKDIPIFNFLTDKNEILLLMEEIVFSPGEYIFNQDKRDDCCLYYLVKGQVELIQTQFQDQEICLAAKSRQEYFGEVSFITGCIRQHSAKAIDFCRVYRINRQQFINTIQQDDRNFELFQMLKDTVIYEKHYDYCSQTCRTCNQKGHYHIYCPKTHLILNKQILAARSFYSQPHFKRINYTRIYRNKYKSLQLIESLKEACYKLSENDEYFDLFNKLERGISQFDEQLSEILNDQFLECINEEDENIISEAQIQQKQIQKSHSFHKTIQKQYSQL